jgi:hypothetical protein
MLVGGMSALVIPDSENPGVIYQESLQESVGFLFSKDGPFGNILIISADGSKKEERLINGGVQFLLNRKEYGILIDMAVPFADRFLKKYQELSIAPYFVAASAHLRMLLDVFNPNNLDGVGFGKTKSEFLKEQSTQYLNRLMEILSV